MAKVASEAGTSFDPNIVEILQQRYIEWERMAREQPAQAPPKLSTDIRVERGAAPAAGFAETAEPPAKSYSSSDSGERLPQAREQAQEVVQIARVSGSAIRVEDILSLLSVRLKHLVPFDSMAVYCPKGETLLPEFVSGENFRLFSSL